MAQLPLQKTKVYFDRIDHYWSATVREFICFPLSLLPSERERDGEREVGGDNTGRVGIWEREEKEEERVRE